MAMLDPQKPMTVLPETVYVGTYIGLDFAVPRVYATCTDDIFAYIDRMRFREDEWRIDLVSNVGGAV